MDDNAMLIVFAVTVFVVSMIAARLPFLFKKGKKIKLHMLITFSTGIMLGVLFVMLLPEALERAMDNGGSAENAAYMIFAGFLLLFIMDFLVKKYFAKDEYEGCDACEHDITSMSAFIGLSIHSFFDGLALAAAFIAGDDVGLMVLIALCLHKAVVVFSLASTMLMSHHRKKTWTYLTVFSLISPLAAVISYYALDTGGLETAGLALCFSVGIFAFVTMCDMLPEAFHHKEKDLRQMGIFLVGIAVVVIVEIVSASLMGGVEI